MIKFINIIMMKIMNFHGSHKGDPRRSHQNEATRDRFSLGNLLIRKRKNKK